MSSPIYLIIDRQNRKLVSYATLAGGAVLVGVPAIPPLFIYDQPVFRVQFVDPPGIIVSGYSQGAPYQGPIDFTGSTLNVDIGPNPVGAGGGAASFSRANAFDSVNKWFLCSALDLSQSGVITLLNGGGSSTPDLEISVWQAGQPQFRMSFNPTLNSVLDTGTIVTPPPGPVTFPSTNEARASFLSKGPTKNDAKIWLSADGTKARRQYLGNDGVLHDDEIPVPPLPLY